MGALNFGPALYGGVRALQDSERMGREEEAHQGDQAIRRSRLESEAELQPIRKRALELGVEDAERVARRRPQVEAQEDELRTLNLDIAKLTQKDRNEAYERLTKAREREAKLNDGLRKFYQSSDPQHVVDAFEASNDIKEEYRGAKAVRDQETGKIILTVPGMPAQTFETKKDKAGNQRSADDYFGMFAMKMLNPVERLKTELTEEFGLAKEAERTDRAIITTGMRAEATVEAARARGAIADGRVSEAWRGRQHNQIKGVLDSMLKPESSPSGFAAAYAFDSDKSLRGKIEELVEADIEAGVPVRRAANNVVEEMRAGYDRLNKEAAKHSTALAKAKIKPTDRKAVEQAAQAGNADARALLKVLEIAKKNLGYSAAKALETQLPTK